MTAPGPLESNRGAIGLKVLLHTNSEGVSSGFKARYFFDEAKPIFGGKLCGSLFINIPTHQSYIVIRNNNNRFFLNFCFKTAVVISVMQILERCRVRISRSNILHRKKECPAERAIGL